MSERKPEKTSPSEERNLSPGRTSAPGQVAGEPSTAPSREPDGTGDHELGHGGMLGAPTADAPSPGSPGADAGARQAGGGNVGPPPYRGSSQHE